MSLKSVVGTFAVPPSISHDTVFNTVDFRPSAGLIWGVNAGNGTTVTDHLYFSFGAFASDSGQASVSTFSEANKVLSTNTIRRHNNSKIISMIDDVGGSTSIIFEADLRSINSSGIALNWSTLDSTGVIFSYILWGGDEITNTSLFEMVSSTGVVESGYSGVGFQPDAGIFFSVLQSGTQSNANNTSFSLGFADGTTQGSTTWESENNIFQSEIAGIQSFGNILIEMGTPGGGDNDEIIQSGRLTEFNSDGYKVQWEKESSLSFTSWGLLFKGGNFQVGSGLQKTSAGEKGHSTTFTPLNVLYSSLGNVANTGILPHITYTLGASSGNVSNTSTWIYEAGGAGLSNTGRINSNSHSIMYRHQSTAVLQAESQVSAISSTGFLNNWTTADSTNRQFMFMAFGNLKSKTSHLFQVGRLTLSSLGV